MNLEKRIKKLEKSNRRMHRVILLLGLVGLAGILVAGGFDSDAFYLRDGDGRIRGTWGMSKETTKSTGIWIADEVGRQRLFIGLNVKGQPGIYLYDEGGKIRWFEQLDAPETPADPKAAKKPDINWPLDLVLVYASTKSPKYFHLRSLKPGAKKCPHLRDEFPRKLYVKDARKKGLLPCPHCYKKCYE